MTKKSNKKITLKWLYANWFIALIQIIGSVLIGYAVLKLKLLPTKYLIIFFAALVIGNFIYFMLLFNNRPKIRTLGKVLSVLISAAMFFGTYQVLNTDQFVGNITGGNKDTHVVSVIVLKDDKAKKLSDLKGITYAFNQYTDEEYTEKTLAEIGKKNKETPATTKVSSNNDLVDGLYDETHRAIILSEAQRSLLLEDYPTFNEDTKVVFASEYHEKVDINTNKPPVNVLKDTTTIFISGIDAFGPVSARSRSDVNMLMTINPQTNQILLTSIPRDYHVMLGTKGKMDKLTHAGIFGVEESVITLEKLFDINIDYFIRVNFSSVTQIVDALGGITVNSQFAFTTGAGQQVSIGNNNMNGTQTLAFVRERYKLPGGDNSRILNQQAALTGILNKAMSPAIITNYNSFLQSINGSFVMSMPENDFKSLIRYQLDTMAPWEIISQAVTGTGAMETTMSYPNRKLYVMNPNMESVRAAHDKIQAMERGERVGQ